MFEAPFQVNRPSPNSITSFLINAREIVTFVYVCVLGARTHEGNTHNHTLNHSYIIQNIFLAFLLFRCRCINQIRMKVKLGYENAHSTHQHPHTYTYTHA